jgi:hypothetical protein
LGGALVGGAFGFIDGYGRTGTLEGAIEGAKEGAEMGD